MGEKMPADVKERLEAAASSLEEAIKVGNVSDIKAKSEALNTLWNEASTKMYEAVKDQPGQQAGPQEQGPQGGQQPGQQSSQAGDGGKKVENADFEVVDDK